MLRQVLACFIALYPFLLDGINDGYSSNILRQERTNTISFEIDNTDLSWIASASIISMPIGSLYCGPLMHIFGRKKMLQSLCLLGLLGWIIIFAAESVVALCVGRFLNGLAMGMQIASIMYISEIADSPKLRAFLLSLMNPALSLGTAFCYTSGHFLPARSYSLTISCLTLFFFSLTFLIPESPAWLTMKDDHEGAAKASKWLRSSQNDHNRSSTDIQVTSVSKGSLLSLGKKIMATKAWKPLIHLTFFFFLQILSGDLVFMYYAANIYDSMQIPLDSSMSAVILSVIEFCVVIFVSCCIDKLDRRTWTKISAAGMFISYSIMAVSEYIRLSAETSSDYWLPVISSWVGAVFSAVGLNSIPWILLGELFPETVSDFMGGLQMTIIYFLQFASIKTYPLLEPVLRIYGFSWVFSVASLLSYFYAQFLMPETRGKTLAEIEKLWL